METQKMKEMEKQIDMNARWENLGISNDFLFGKVMQILYKFI